MLDIKLSTILFQAINFIVLAVILYFLMFKKIFENAKTRKDKQENIEQATMENFEASEKAKLEIEKQLGHAQTLIDQKVSQAKSEIEVSRFQVIDATKAEAEKIITNAIKTAEDEQKHSIEKYNTELTTSIMEIVKLLLSKYSPEVIHNNLVSQTNERIWELGKKEMARVDTIRKSLKDREPILTLESAFPLTKEQQATIIRTFSALADKNVKLKMELNTDLGAGIRLRLGDFIINNSLNALLDDIKNKASQEVNQLVKKLNGK